MAAFNNDPDDGLLHALRDRQNTLERLKLVPWEDIWTSLRVAKTHVNGKSSTFFYDNNFKEATFDDKGAWSSRI